MIRANLKPVLNKLIYINFDYFELKFKVDLKEMLDQLVSGNFNDSIFVMYKMYRYLLYAKYGSDQIEHIFAIKCLIVFFCFFPPNFTWLR